MCALPGDSLSLSLSLSRFPLSWLVFLLLGKPAAVKLPLSFSPTAYPIAAVFSSSSSSSSAASSGCSAETWSGTAGDERVMLLSGEQRQRQLLRSFSPGLWPQTD